jgi:hypothetical protein
MAGYFFPLHVFLYSGTTRLLERPLFITKAGNSSAGMGFHQFGHQQRPQSYPE